MPLTEKPGECGLVVTGVLDCRFFDPCLNSDWDGLIAKHPEVSLFHGGSWAKVLTKTYRQKPYYVGLSHRGSPVAMVPLMEVSSCFTGKRGICVPFSDACVPLTYKDRQSEWLLSILSLARERNWKYIEMRGDSDLAGAQPSEIFYRHTLDLRCGCEGVKKGFSSAARGAIRKAKSSGIRIQIDRSHKAISEFYRLHIRTRRRHGLPPQPLAFFKQIFSEIIESGHGFVVLAKSGPATAAAAIFFEDDTRALYKFAASDERLLNYCGNNLVIWEAIQHLVREGFEYLDFGRTALQNVGLRRFKLAWGSKEELIRYFRYDLSRNTWVNKRDLTLGFHNEIFRRLPLLLSRFFGTLIYPHLD